MKVRYHPAVKAELLSLARLFCELDERTRVAILVLLEARGLGVDVTIMGAEEFLVNMGMGRYLPFSTEALAFLNSLKQAEAEKDAEEEEGMDWIEPKPASGQ